jgi:hypothetical protein
MQKKHLLKALSVLTIFIVLLVFSPIETDALLSCNISTDPCGAVEFFQISPLATGHLSIDGTYSLSQCCSENVTTLANTCADRYSVILRHNSPNNAHVEMGNMTTGGYSNLCMSTDTVGRVVDCSYIAGDLSCAVNYTCIATMTDKTNSHVGNCTDFTSPDNYRLCCYVKRVPSYISGNISVQDPANLSRWMNATDFSTGDLVNVSVFNTSNNFLFATTNDIDVNGTKIYHLRLPYSALNMNLTVSYHSPGYSTETITVNITEPYTTYLPTPNLSLATGCRPDCTMNDGICHADCHGLGGCFYNDSIVATSGAFAGQNMSTICDGSLPGWRKQLNDTHYFDCCNGRPQSRLDIPLNTTLDRKIENLKTYQHIVMIRGKKYKMYVSVWEWDEDAQP